MRAGLHRMDYFKFKFQLVLAFVFSIFATLTFVGYAFVFQYLVDSIVVADVEGVVISTVVLIMTFALYSVSSYFHHYYLNGYFQRFFTCLKQRLFNNFIRCDYLTFYEKGEGDYLNTLTTLMDDLRNQYLMPFVTMVSSSFLALFSLAAIFFYNIFMGLLAILLLTIQVIVPVLRKKTTSRVSQAYVAESGEFSAKTSNLLGAFELIVSSNMLDKASRMFGVNNKKFEQSKMERNNTIALSNALIFLCECC